MLRAAITSLDLGAVPIDTTAARLGVQAGVTSVLSAQAIETEAARLRLRAGITTVEAARFFIPEVECAILTLGVECGAI
jgi:hypothetical protein